MGFLDLFRPNWKHSDLERRLRAVRELEPSDEKILCEVIKTDRDEHLRRVALKKLDNPRLLLGFAESLDLPALREAAGELANERLLADAVSDREQASLGALALIKGEREVANVARRARRAEVRRAAVARLSDPKLLSELVLRAEDDDVRVSALARLEDASSLAEIATSGKDKRIAIAALARVTEVTALAKIAKEAMNRAVRDAAAARLPADGATTAPAKSKAKTAPTAPVDKVRKAQQLALCVAAEGAARQDAPASELAELRQKWAELDGDAAKPAMRDRFAAALALHAQRAKEREEDQRRRAAAKEAAIAKAKAAAAEAAAVASAPPPVVVAAAPAPVEPVAPPAPVVVEPTVEERLAALCAEAERGLRHADRASALEARFRAADPGGDEEERVALRARFTAAIEIAAARRREVEEKLRADRAELITALEGAITRLDGASAGDRRQAIDRAIKDAHPLEGRLKNVAAGEDLDPVRARLTAALDKAATRLNELHDAERWKHWANLPKLEQICQEAEALAEVIATVEDKRRAPVVMTELRNRWKELSGPPSDRQKALWERFKKAGDQVHELTREFFAKLGEESAGAMARKEELCVKVEALAASVIEGAPPLVGGAPPLVGGTPTSLPYKETAEKIVALQAEWKLAGHVPGEKGEAVWTRFRAACDKFFARRNEVEGTSDADREANLARMEAILAQVTELATSTDWRQTADVIKGLQQEWKEIGELPRGRGGLLWKRFRTACDAFFDARKAAFDAEDGQRAENLAKKQLLCERAEALSAFPPEEHQAAMDQAKALQAEWKTIGHVPREAQDQVWKRFRTACDAVFGKPSEDVAELPETAPAPVAAAPVAGTEPVGDGSGISGFTNRLPLDKILGKPPEAETVKAKKKAKEVKVSDSKDEKAETAPAPAAGESGPTPTV